MKSESLLEELQALRESVSELRAEADIRRIMARYMLLCDIPLPEPGLDMDGRVRSIVDLFSKDACWEGVGTQHNSQFGASFGSEQIARHFERFFQRRDPIMIFNCHYLTCEQIHVRGDSADGQWVHFQPWIFEDGSSVLRSSRLNNLFRNVDGVWKITRYRSESLFTAPLPNNWATGVAATSVLMKP